MTSYVKIRQLALASLVGPTCHQDPHVLLSTTGLCYTLQNSSSEIRLMLWNLPQQNLHFFSLLTSFDGLSLFWTVGWAFSDVSRNGWQRLGSFLWLGWWLPRPGCSGTWIPTCHHQPSCQAGELETCPRKQIKRAKKKRDIARFRANFANHCWSLRTWCDLMRVS